MAALQLLANGSVFCERERERDGERLLALAASKHQQILEALQAVGSCTMFQPVQRSHFLYLCVILS